MPTEKMPWWALLALAGGVLVTFDAALLIAHLRDENTLLTTLATGALNAMMLALGYFFGSSAGSSKKDDALVAQATAPPQPRGGNNP